MAEDRDKGEVNLPVGTSGSGSKKSTKYVLSSESSVSKVTVGKKRLVADGEAVALTQEEVETLSAMDGVSLNEA